MHILAVDDDPIILNMLEQVIGATTTHQVTTALSAEDALNVIDTNTGAPFNCFLLDMAMPEVDGVALCSTLRPKFPDAPIVMLSGNGDRASIDLAFAAGATDYVVKPFEVTDLRDRLQALEILGEATERTNATAVSTYGFDEPSLHQTGRFDIRQSVDLSANRDVISWSALENYVSQLGRSDILGSKIFALTLRQVQQILPGLTDQVFQSMIKDMAQIISDQFEDDQLMVSYVGSGTFVCVAGSKQSVDTDALCTKIDATFAEMNFEARIGISSPTVCASGAITMLWRSGDAACRTLARAIEMAETESYADKDATSGLSFLRKFG